MAFQAVGTETNPILEALEAAKKLLPHQGPMGVFIHQNTLGAFEDLSFHDAVQTAAPMLGAQPYWPEATFRRLYAAGRISRSDLDAAIVDRLGETASKEQVAGTLTRASLLRALMVYDVDAEGVRGAAWTRQHRSPPPDDAWATVARPSAATGSDLRLWDLLGSLEETALRARLIEALSRFSGAFLDRGQATGAMPGREEGFLRAVAQAYAHAGVPPLWAPSVREAVVGAVARQQTLQAVLSEVVADFKIPQAHVKSFVLDAALLLPGWAGMFLTLSKHPHSWGHAPPPFSLDEFLIVLVLHLRAGLEDVAQRHGLAAEWGAFSAAASRQRGQKAKGQIALLVRVREALLRDDHRAPDLKATSPQVLSKVAAEVEAFPSVERRRVWQEALERGYRHSVLNALAAARARPRAAKAPPVAQVVFCIDEREESFRRALEEQGPFETYGAAGFFGMAIDYKGLDDAHPAPYCPAPVTPAHEVHERPHADVAPGDAQQGERVRARIRAVLRWVRGVSRSLFVTAFWTVLVGPLAAFIVALRLIAPRGSMRLRTKLVEAMGGPERTQLAWLREEGDDRSARGVWLGFSRAEATDRVAALLQNIGLTSGFAPVVVMMGHGSTSLNNPHESAHDCGACGGRRGGANARLFAEAANHPDVRAGLAHKGIVIPPDVRFVGGLHDTANDDVTLFDWPEAPSKALLETRRALDASRALNAQERARRFEAAPQDLTPERALFHVQERASHLAQVRPEYGHATNASCIVGRRAMSEGLFFDRRAFLVSYDATQDPSGAIIERILAAVGPVGAGISLEYYFSAVDNERFGCGTKLPHNVTGYLGVMNGTQGDLRTGLPWQMVEIHEPMRLLLVVEAEPAVLLAAAGKLPEVCRLVTNGWVQLASVHPVTGAMAVFKGGQFVPFEPEPIELPSVERSPDWHGGKSHPLPPALIVQRGRHAA